MRQVAGKETSVVRAVIADAASQLVHGTERLVLVVDESQRLVGVVARDDLLHALAGASAAAEPAPAE